MKDRQLKDIDSDDMEDLLVKVETSFDIRFVGNELSNITTFGQFCEHIANKIQLDHSDDCTSQQAFYKLRDALSSRLQIDKKTILRDYPLSDILPRKSRRSSIKKLEKHLGFKLNILRPSYWVSGILAILFFTSIVSLLFHWQLGFTGLLFSIAGFWFAHKAATELDLQTVGQVAEKMTRENYLKSRRNSKSFNKAEIEKIVTDLFIQNLDLDKSKLTKDAKFI